MFVLKQPSSTLASRILAVKVLSFRRRGVCREIPARIVLRADANSGMRYRHEWERMIPEYRIASNLIRPVTEHKSGRLLTGFASDTCDRVKSVTVKKEETESAHRVVDDFFFALKDPSQD